MADKPGNQTPNTLDVSETDDVGAGPDGGKLRTGEETSSSLRYSQEVTSPDEEPERAGRSLATTHHEVIKEWAEARNAVPPLSPAPSTRITSGCCDSTSAATTRTYAM